MAFDEEEADSSVAEVIEAYKRDVEETELDLSSASLYEIPADVFSLDVLRIVCLNLDYNEIYDLPEEVGLLQNLQTFTAIGNNLENLPDKICNLLNLKELVVNENQLVELPTSLGNLSELHIISLIGNQLSALPDSFTDLQHLEELYLDENELSFIPGDIGKLGNLKMFETSSNKLSCLPESVGNLHRLELFNCSHNQLSQLPETFSNIPCLKILDASHNKLDALPDRMECASVLEKLFLENNDLKCVPPWFGSLTSLEELSVADNYLNNEPFNDEFCTSCRKLRKLDAGGNFMLAVSEQLGCLSQLQFLHLGSTIHELERSHFQNGNWLSKLPESICNLKFITRMNINENQIPELPANFGDLSSLEWLDVGQNLLEYLPVSFCNLKKLRYLQLSKNILKALPENIGNLCNLQELRMDSNCLTELPASLADISCLEALDVFDNKLKELPLVVFKLRALKRLDIDQNDFKMNIQDIPKITPTNNYPARDSKLKDNWRGKTRPDKLRSDVIKLNIETDPAVNEEEDEEEMCYNVNALQAAMRRGMSLWRSHKSSELSSREVFNRASEKLAVKDDDDDEWMALTYGPAAKVDCSTTPAGGANGLEDEEDWDREIQEHKQYHRVMETCESRKDMQSTLIGDFENTVNQYPPSEQAFSHTANYESFVYRGSTLQCAAGGYGSNYSTRTRLNFVDGQFDDADC